MGKTQSSQQPAQSSAKRAGGIGTWAMIVAIVIVLNLFFNYAISLVYKMPAYDEYVPTSQAVIPITDQAACLSVGGQWTAPDSSAPGATGYCDPNYTKEMQFTAARYAYSRNVFIVLVVLGVVSLVLGAIFANVILTLAFSWGGVLSLVIASLRYWSEAGSVTKVIVLGIALAALIWIAVKKFGK